MRIYTDLVEAFTEVERDLFEMGIDVYPNSMQDKWIAMDPNFATKEVRAYGFKLSGVRPPYHAAVEFVFRQHPDKHQEIADVMRYIELEFGDRVSGLSSNPGHSWEARRKLWTQFLQPNGKFHYTYSDRISAQLTKIIRELQDNKDTRQAIVTIHSNIVPGSNDEHGDLTIGSIDLERRGGVGRVPCSLYYQFMRREGKVDMIYVMRSCDYLTHFPVDIVLALLMHEYVASSVGELTGTFTYFTGSLHAYAKDLKTRGIF